MSWKYDIAFFSIKLVQAKNNRVGQVGVPFLKQLNRRTEEPATLFSISNFKK